jgi:tRNA nucleotidyltransferase/poly(A) polymerase
VAWETVSDYVRSLGLDAWEVGGAVRDMLLGIPHKDTDYVVPGVGYEELRAALAPHGRVEDLTVNGRHVGVRLYPRDKAARALAPAGIEFAPPRVERSTGPGRHDFEIVADASIPLAEDMRRRDFTVNAIARNVETGELLDPLDGQGDIERRVLRTTSPTSFRDDPLRIVRGLRLVSQLGFEPDEDTLRQMRDWAPQVALVSAERIGGGLAADGMGELSKLLLGREPARALRLARDTGVLVAIIPEYEPALGYDQASRFHELPLDEHHFQAVQAAADAGAPLAVRLALLVHDLGKPATAWRGDDGLLHYYTNEELGKPGHEEVGAEIALTVLGRLRYPTALRRRVRQIVQRHMFFPPRHPDATRARRFLAKHGESLALDLLAHKEADLRGKGTDPAENLALLHEFRDLVLAERNQPHRLRDLAITGDDLLELGYPAGPVIGATLERLLHDVVGDPSLNRREWLLREAERLR